MKQNISQQPLSGGIVTGVFVGIFATIACLVFNLIYRAETGYALSELINVSSLIFAVNTLFLLTGLLYAVFLRLFKNGNLLFKILFVAITLFLAWKSEGVHRSEDPALTTMFRNLLAGTVLILGLSTAFVLPFLYNNKWFKEEVL